MRIWVTGASGFVGRHFVSRLEGEDHEVFASDLELDVTLADEVAAALRRTRPSAILHLAAESSVTRSLANPAGCFRANFLGSRNLLMALARHAPEARLLLVGSADQYGTRSPGAPPVRETDPLYPRSPYARSKAAAEGLGNLAFESGLDVVRVRPFNHTGPGQSDAFVASSFARQLAEIERGLREPILRVGNLQSIRDFLDVRDVIEAYLGLLNPDVPADIYNIASGSSVRVGDVLQKLLDHTEVRPEIQPDPERMRPTDIQIGDGSRLEAATGWVPQAPLSDTLLGVLNYWRARVSEPGTPVRH
jgi:GDP-4-dehydro-6-deoxy-D-mannose reductase